MHDTRRLPREGGHLCYTVAGAGPAVLLIHGLGSCAADWTPQIEALAKSHTLIAPDLRGHGASLAASGVLPIAQHVRDLCDLLAHEGLDEVDVVGLSMGGAVAFQLALESAPVVRSLTIVNSAPAFVVRNWRERLMVAQRFAIVHLLGLPRMARVLAGRLFPGQDTLQAEFVERFSRNDKASYLAAMRGLLGWSVQQRLGEIRCPVLVVAADQDYMPLADKQAYCAEIPDARLVVIENAHHAVTAEHPQAFNRALTAFLDGNAVGQAA